MRKVNTGFDFAKIREALDAETWERDDENPGTVVRRVWLGTWLGISPSGKVYAPFACSNVAGDCPVCKGKGSREPRTGKRIRKRARARERAFSRGTVKRGFAPNCPAYVKRVQAYRDAAHRASDTTCDACNGHGSISAARDERWTEALEEEAEKIGAFVDHIDDSVFITEARDVGEEDEGDEPYPSYNGARVGDPSHGKAFSTEP